jgi:beta-galactosidase
MRRIAALFMPLSVFIRSLIGVAIASIILHLDAFGQSEHLVSPRQEYNFNGQWRLHLGDEVGFEAVEFDDSAWKQCTLPRAWNEDEAFAVDIHGHSTGIAWYRKKFVLPQSATSKKIFLEFEGVRQAARAYINGREACLHENGVMAFGVDITNFVRSAPAENVIAVRTDNDWRYRDHTGQRFQWADSNFNANYGGITKNVVLHVTEKLYQTLPLYSNLGTVGTYIYADNFDIPNKTATIHAESEVRNEYDRPKSFSYEVEVIDASGDVLAKFASDTVTASPDETVKVSASAIVKNLQFWSWGYGYLYDVRTTLIVDGVSVDTVINRTGFRKAEARDGMFLLNDRVLQIKGYAQRTSNEWPGIGLSSAPWLSDFSNRMMVEGNANTVRWMHITPSKQDIESCDRVGLMMLMPAGDSEGDVEGRRWEQRMELMRDAVIYNRNNPSVVFIEGGNEAISEPHMAEIKEIRDKYDPHGRRLVGSREMLDSEVAQWGGEMLYINKSSDIPLFATEYCRDEALRKYWDDWSPPFHKDGDGPLHKGQRASAYNRNQDSFAIENVRRWFDYWEARPGTGKRVSAGGLNIIFSDTNTHMRGAENYRRSGEVDPMRIPKDSYFAHRIIWDGWVDTKKRGLHIVGHWNYTPDTVKPIYVISTADEVELFLNGHSLGKAEQSSRFIFTIPEVKWQKGTLSAIGYDVKGKKVCSGELVTTGPATSLRLTHWKNPTGFRADGADLVLVQVEAIDEKGQRCPTSMDMVEFHLEGEADWRGGIAQGRDDNYILSQSLPLECGVNRILLRSTPVPGEVLLRATAYDLAPATLTLKSQPIDNRGGISKSLPSKEQPLFLELGPTPLEPSYSESRRAIHIDSITAGSSSDDASRTLDDNELTRWTSGQRKENAWITYHFGKPELINQVCLKLDRWRTNTYPITLSVGNKVVWSGKTGRSLGYVTLDFEPVEATSLTIALEGAVTARDGFEQITEVSQIIEDQTIARGPRLSIVEAEVYGLESNN